MNKKSMIIATLLAICLPLSASYAQNVNSNNLQNNMQDNIRANPNCPYLQNCIRQNQDGANLQNKRPQGGRHLRQNRNLNNDNTYGYRHHANSHGHRHQNINYLNDRPCDTRVNQDCPYNGVRQYRNAPRGFNN